ncbi:hypothetical protein [Nakamurella endophytica]|uniref:Uncharacterized protein n=1 Tax=Nakamurella endophytica TaxID=1748367 RepID=A0A917WMV3_9ACTN|nr:hypothetical protein [Nakamurella endophytica]GGM15177.1 hypothetical protein GCM10011594_38990 [Nakamurella endophytica]
MLVDKFASPVIGAPLPPEPAVEPDEEVPEDEPPEVAADDDPAEDAGDDSADDAGLETDELDDVDDPPDDEPPQAASSSPALSVRPVRTADLFMGSSGVRWWTASFCA